MVEKLHKFTDSVIAERRRDLENEKNQQSSNTNATSDKVEGAKRRLAFLDLLLNEKSLTNSDIREEVDTFMFEGHDTTAAGMTWCLYLLARHPHIQSEVRAEVDAAWPDDDYITHDHLSKMPLLENCLKEAQRLYPSVPFFGRQVEHPLNLEGVDIPVGATLLCLTSALHRDASVFPNPEEFRPSR